MGHQAVAHLPVAPVHDLRGAAVLLGRRDLSKPLGHPADSGHVVGVELIQRLAHEVRQIVAVDLVQKDVVAAEVLPQEGQAIVHFEGVLQQLFVPVVEGRADAVPAESKAET